MSRSIFGMTAPCPELEELFDIEREMEQYRQDLAIPTIEEESTDLVDWINNCNRN